MQRHELTTHKGIVHIGTRIRIIHLNNGNSKIDDSDYDGKEGVVAFFDQIPPEANPGMHGSWGGLAVYDTDEFEILTGYEEEKEAPLPGTADGVARILLSGERGRGPCGMTDRGRSVIPEGPLPLQERQANQIKSKQR